MNDPERFSIPRETYEQMRRRLDTYETHVADLRDQLDGLRRSIRSDSDHSMRGFYRHYKKGDVYFVVGVADGIDHQGPPLVIYEGVQGVQEGKLQVRTLEDFCSTVTLDVSSCAEGYRTTKVPRFERIG